MTSPRGSAEPEVSDDGDDALVRLRQYGHRVGLGQDNRTIKRRCVLGPRSSYKSSQFRHEGLGKTSQSASKEDTKVNGYPTKQQQKSCRQEDMASSGGSAEPKVTVGSSCKYTNEIRGKLWIH